MQTTLDKPDRMHPGLKGRAACEVRSALELILRRGEQIQPGKRFIGRRVKLLLALSKRPGTVALDNARIADVIRS